MVIYLKTELINSINSNMKPFLDENQIKELNLTLDNILKDFEIIKKDKILTLDESRENQDLLKNFLSAKQVEGCSERTINYYKSTINKMLDCLKLKIE